MSKPIALVTGAGTGIAKVIAAALLSAGYAVAMTGRRLEVLEAATAKLGDELFVHRADIGHADEVDGLFAAVNMAGLALLANVLSMTIMATKMPFVGRG